LMAAPPEAAARMLLQKTPKKAALPVSELVT
jgi:hypothetical protein